MYSLNEYSLRMFLKEFLFGLKKDRPIWLRYVLLLPRAIVWFLLIFLVGRFALDKTLLISDIVNERGEFREYIGEVHTSDDTRKLLSQIQRDLWLRKILHNTVLLRPHFKPQVNDRLSRNLNLALLDETLFPEQKIILQTYVTIYGNCCDSQPLDWEAVVNSMDSFAVREQFSNQEFINHTRYKLATMILEESTYHNLKTPFLYDDSYWKSAFIYGAGGVAAMSIENSMFIPGNIRSRIQGAITTLISDLDQIIVNKGELSKEVDYKLMILYNFYKFNLVAKPENFYTPEGYNRCLDSAFILQSDFFRSLRILSSNQQNEVHALANRLIDKFESHPLYNNPIACKEGEEHDYTTN